MTRQHSFSVRYYSFARIRAAQKLAAASHSRQYRKERHKGKRLPYIIHPVGAAELLLGFAAPEDEVVAELLHDTLEDTKLTAAQIEKQFGAYVLSLVKQMTEPKGKTWQARKEAKILALREGSLALKRVAAADHCDNLLSLLDVLVEEGWQTAAEFTQAKVWEKFKQPYALQKKYHQESCKAIFANVPLADLPPLFGKLMRLVERIFGEEVIFAPAVRRKVRRRNK